MWPSPASSCSRTSRRSPAIYFWLLLGQTELAENTVVVTITGVVFIAAMVYVSYRGIEIGEKLQNVLLGIQYLALVLFVVFAFGSVIMGTAPGGDRP